MSSILRTNEFNIALTKAQTCTTDPTQPSEARATRCSRLAVLQGYGIDAFREDEKKFLISAGAGAAKADSLAASVRVVMA